MLAWALLLASQTNPLEMQVLDRVVGEYRHVGDRDRQTIEEAIERVVSSMLWPASEIARSRLLETNQIPRRLSISRSGDRVRISFDGRLRETAIHTHPVIVVGLAGDELRYTLEIDGGAVQQRFEGDGGGRLNTIRAERDELLVTVVVFSDRLPANVMYQLRYQRIRSSTRAER